MLGGAALGRVAEAEQEIKNVNLASSPSTLKITDMRYAVIVKPGPSPCVLIRIDTNQGVYGLGEVRDIAGPQYAMVLKSRILGENPLRIDYLFQKIAQFGGNARQAGGVCAVEMALWDIAGKVYNIPVYQMLGGKWRDEIRIYADTTESMDPAEYGAPRQRAQSDGPDLDEDGPGHQRARWNARHGDAACRPGQVGSSTFSPTSSSRPRSPTKASTGCANTWPRCAKTSATTCRSRWITSATSA